jgi:hypothetical protein
MIYNKCINSSEIKFMSVNKELLIETLETIKANPQHWNQENWHCGTTHCFAGFCELIVKGESLKKEYLSFPEDVSIYNFWENTREFSRKQLNLSEYDSDILFRPSNSLEDLERLVNYLIVHGNFDDIDEENCGYYF